MHSLALSYKYFENTSMFEAFSSGHIYKLIQKNYSHKYKS